MKDFTLLYNRIMDLPLVIANATHYYLSVSDALPENSSTRPFAKAAEPPPRVSSRELLGTHSELIIEHQGREYRLRITQNGKLILTA
jgi:hemin uptake protein HemP